MTDTTDMRSKTESKHCLNCGAVLVGKYCAQCGQEDWDKPPSIKVVFGELVAGLFHADSRLWRSLWALMAKPGFLPKEYFAGRRVRYLPPMRMYLLSSLAFFLLLSMTASFAPPIRFDDQGRFISGNDNVDATLTITSLEKADTTPEAATTAAEPSAKSPVPTPENSNAADIGTAAINAMPAAALEKLQSRIAEASPEDKAALERVAAAIEQEEGSDTGGLNPETLRAIEDCDVGYTGSYEEQLKPKLVSACKQFKADGGRSLIQRFISNMPTAMFVLMPVFSAAMLLFYWSPRRYFTEHLLFQVCNHSAFFVLAFFSRLVGLAMPEGDTGWFDPVLAVYVLYYCYRSLRVYYEQSRWMTLFKFSVLFVIYLLSAFFVMFSAGVASIL